MNQIFGWAALAVSVSCIPASAADDLGANGGSTGGSGLLGGASAFAAAAQSPGQLSQSALSMGSDAVRHSLIPALWPTAPQWLQRTEWDIQANSINGAQYNVLTTQPLHQSNDKRDTFFTQGSYEHYNLYGIARNTVNGGLGYRRLLLDDSLLLGVNNFYDYELGHDHARSSIGAEAKYGVLDAYTNYYFRLNGAKEVDGGTERVTNGYDIGLGAPLPYLPWASLNARYYRWDGIVGKDTDGGEFSAEFALHPNLTLVAGTRGDQPDTNKQDNYITLQFRLGDNGRPTLMSEPVSAHAFETRDLSQYTLDKVRRENRILIERTTTTTGGITVVVKKG